MKMRTFLILCFILTTPLLGAAEPKKTKLTISPETTYFTEPRLPDGRVDYYAAINRYISEGITNENNVVPNLFSCIAGEQEAPMIRDKQETGKFISGEVESFRGKFWKQLGYDAPPDLDSLQLLLPEEIAHPLNFLQKYYSKDTIEAKVERLRERDRQYYRSLIDSKDTTAKDKEKHAYNLKEIDKNPAGWYYRSIILNEWEQMLDKLWTAKDSPLMDGWMKSTTPLAKKLIEFVKLPRFYHPQVSDDTSNCTYLSLLPYAQGTRQTARYLQIRGHWHFAREEYEEAFECAFATLQLGVTMQKDGESLVTVLVGIAIEGIANFEITLYLHELRESKDAAWILAKKKAYDVIVSSKKTSDPPKWLVMERIGMLSAVQWYLSDPAAMIKLIVEDGGVEEKLLKKCLDSNYDYDWDHILKTINGYFDDYEDILTLPELKRQRRAIQRLETRLETVLHSIDIRAENIEKLDHPFAKEQLVTDFLCISLFPSITAPYQAHLRNTSIEGMADIAFALAAYRAEHKSYPQTLDTLVPKYLNEIPISPYTDQPIRYVKRNDKVLLLNNDTYTLDGSETEIEKQISEVEKSVEFLHPQVRTCIIVLGGR